MISQLVTSNADSDKDTLLISTRTSCHSTRENVGIMDSSDGAIKVYKHHPQNSNGMGQADVMNIDGTPTSGFNDDQNERFVSTPTSRVRIKTSLVKVLMPQTRWALLP